MLIMSYFERLALSPLFFLTLTVVTGLLVGRIRFRGISLGSSGALFTGLAAGWIGAEVPESLFMWNLMIFVTAVGLISSKDIVNVIKHFGFRFIWLSIAVTGSGAAVAYLVSVLSSGAVSPLLVGGAYTGALTSSPGLGAAIEAAGGDPLVTIGYTIAYPIGVVLVVLFVQLIPVLCKVDMVRERDALVAELSQLQRVTNTSGRESVPFTLISFALCMIGGMLIGAIAIPLPFIGSFSLGSAGGALLFALFAGARGRIGPFQMRMHDVVLSSLRSISLVFFLAVMGILAGPDIPKIFGEHGLLLVTVGITAAAAGLAAGFIIGRLCFKMNWVLLCGAVTGAMTSTPGLGAAIEITQCDESAAGYGATYPVAICCMVIFTKLIMQSL